MNSEPVGFVGFCLYPAGSDETQCQARDLPAELHVLGRRQVCRKKLSKVLPANLFVGQTLKVSFQELWASRLCWAMPIPGGPRRDAMSREGPPGRKPYFGSPARLPEKSFEGSPGKFVRWTNFGKFHSTNFGPVGFFGNCLHQADPGETRCLARARPAGRSRLRTGGGQFLF